jgi:hypothetical protein
LRAAKQVAPGCNLQGLAAGDNNSAGRITYAFCLVLERTPSDDELKEWTAFLGKGRPNAQMVIAMLASPEFRDRHKVWSFRPSEFVMSYRRRLYGRDPDASAVADLVARLEAGTLSRAGAVEEFVGSAEFAAIHPLLANATARNAK